MTPVAAGRRTKIRFAEAEDVAALGRFYERLRAGGRREKLSLDWRLPGEERNRPADFPVERRLMIAEDGQEVRASMLLLHSTIWVRGEERPFCWVQLPLSEGLIDRAYSMSIVQLVRRALSHQPFLMELGVGSLDEDWSRFLIKLGWKHAPVPFLFYPVRATKVLCGLNYLKTRPKLRLGAAIAAYSGAGALLSAGLRLQRRLARGIPPHRSRREASFGDWADRIFERAVPDYGAVVRRDAATLNILYPPEDKRFIRLRVHGRSGEDLGWIVVIKTRMRDDQYFGNLHVGTLVDGFGRAADVPALVAAGLQYLARAGVDLVVANWSHGAWVEASRRVGFQSGPSNFFFFTAPAAAPLLDEACPLSDIHLTRGDCDGPVKLLGAPIP